ncbi:MAG: hypothetical protein IBX50_16950 [Marinospirillum sp.]|uniref:hypothetical protein n=1 Tax=Marinospirillum sp. TaxID=2183934 RepID=UPI0019EF8351|nr:hypothetical protein [Marinospirillum sp.]MBE0508379.1 hypothetical protein [Marinospirillum sp.]
MSDLVHFLVRDPVVEKAAIYPSELPDEGYVAYPFFCFLGADDLTLRDSYVFYAIKGEEVIPVDLRRVRNRKTHFVAEVDGVGFFDFTAKLVRSDIKYHGATQKVSGLKVLRRIKPNNPVALDSAIRDKGFYFIGYTPRLTHLAD